MTTDTPAVACVSHRFSASAERVFDAWLDVELARRFFFTIPTGELVRAEIDPRVGGRFCFVDRRDGVDVVHTGEYLELERPRRLAFNFSVDGADPSYVRIDITPLDAGCELMLTHEMHPRWADFRERAERGWAMMLGGIDAALRG